MLLKLMGSTRCKNTYIWAPVMKKIRFLHLFGAFGLKKSSFSITFARLKDFAVFLFFFIFLDLSLGGGLGILLPGASKSLKNTRCFVIGAQMYAYLHGFEPTSLKIIEKHNVVHHMSPNACIFIWVRAHKLQTH